MAQIAFPDYSPGQDQAPAEAVELRLVANAGVLLRYRGAALWLDAVFSGQGHGFGAPGPELWRAMAEGQPPFQETPYLLFTHCHADHFSPQRTLELVQRRAVKGLALPQSSSQAEEELQRQLTRRGIPFLELSERTDGAVLEPEPGIRIRALKTLHLDRIYRSVAHFCYLLEVGSRRLLFTADVDYTQETLEPLASEPLDGVFLNPLFFNALCHRRFFKGKFQARRLWLYHLPPEGDRWGMGDALERNLAAWPPEYPPATALRDPLKPVFF